MKPLLGLLTIICASATTWAQGTVSFSNTVFADQANPRLVTLDGLPLTGTDLVAQLYYGTQGTAMGSLTAVGAVARFRVNTTSQPGTWSGGTRTLPGITAGQTATLSVRVWNATLFPAGYDTAVAGGGLRGSSALFDYTVPSSGTPAPNEFWMWNFGGMAVMVPERSTIALGVLGALGLLVLRRGPASRQVVG